MSKSSIPFERIEYEGTMTVEEALRRRKSIRSFKRSRIPSQVVGRLLWATYGLRHFNSSGRTAPSAGACYPLIIYVIIGKDSVSDLKAGIYRYSPTEHTLIEHKPGDFRKQLAQAALSQDFIEAAPFSIAISAIFSRTTSSYGERGMRYLYIDCGHAGQNIYLQATSLGLGTVAVGAFRDSEVSRILSLPDDENPLYIMPIGYPSSEEL